MVITLGKMQKTKARFPGDSLVYRHADMLVNGQKIGSVHQSGYKPRWAFNINPFRWSAGVFRYAEITGDSRHFATYGLLFDGAAWDSAELAREACEKQLTRFEAAKPTLDKLLAK